MRMWNMKVIIMCLRIWADDISPDVINEHIPITDDARFIKDSSYTWEGIYDKDIVGVYWQDVMPTSLLKYTELWVSHCTLDNKGI